MGVTGNTDDSGTIVNSSGAEGATGNVDGSAVGDSSGGGDGSGDGQFGVSIKDQIVFVELQCAAHIGFGAPEFHVSNVACGVDVKETCHIERAGNISVLIQSAFFVVLVSCHLDFAGCVDVQNTVDAQTVDPGVRAFGETDGHTGTVLEIVGIKDTAREGHIKRTAFARGVAVEETCSLDVGIVEIPGKCAGGSGFE